MPDPIEKAIEERAPNGVDRKNGLWLRTAPGDKIVMDFAAAQHPEAIRRSDYLTPQQLATRIRDCECEDGFVGDGAFMGPCAACSPLRRLVGLQQ